MGFGCAIIGLLTVFGADDIGRPEMARPDFGRDVRPILAENCFVCHGPDAAKRQVGLRLDLRDDAIARLEESGNVAIVPGRPAVSELVRRIRSQHNDVMPPRESLKHLTEHQQQTLVRWIESGAEYRPHWSFVTPTRPTLPVIRDAAWPRGPLDQFVLAKLSILPPSPRRGGLGRGEDQVSGPLLNQPPSLTLPAEGREPEQQDTLASLPASPSREADRSTVLRRVTFDLTGLPPSLDEVEACETDLNPDAFERAVDRLLASPRYGEHMARDWLDQARYADTHGYFTDHERFMWAWRDWVIDAFNRNLPFDQFTIEQLAGDLLPDATLSQRIATGFNRNHMITEETGVIPEESRTEYVADRVRTTAAVWMGLTAGCAQCHDHKYDPLTQREFFQLFAYFNQLPEAGIAGGKQKNAAPELRLPSPEQTARQADLSRAITEVETSLASLVPPKEVPLEQAPASALRPGLEARRTLLRDAEKQHLSTIPTTMVMQDMPIPRDTFIQVRGQYDQLGDKVTPGVPRFLPPLPNDAPPNRLALAKWLVDERHPLTARVAVNRLWRQLFGHGIVTTVEDFGLQGAWPSHPELLDWLAVEYRGESGNSKNESGEPGGVSPRILPLKNPGADAARLTSTFIPQPSWSTKRLQRLIVTSATYRQSSHLSAESRRSDPRNVRLGRAPRYRLDAEAIRDAALFSGGLLAERIGGPSVKPYQPKDLWKAVVYDTNSEQFYEPSHGEGLFRRSLYTYWKRQVPPPSMQQLDAPTREVCVLRRQRTNTPLQALVLLNDPQFVEAARGLAQRMIESSLYDPARLTTGFRIVTSRRPSPTEQQALLTLLASERTRFQSQPAATNELLQVGTVPIPNHINRPDLAAWTVVANVLLNLDEAISRE